MLFDPKALHNKALYLDAILQKPSLLESVISRHIPKTYRYFQLSRVWEPGGGATLFRIESSNGPLLLKVKHQSVYVESRLEGEPTFLRKPSLQNECDFLRLLTNEEVARVFFFDEEECFQFLAMEWIESFHATTQTMTAPQLLEVWQRIVNIVKTLFDKGIVHTDIHEQNICFRDNKPILIDFEEARFLRQDVAFEDSLDVVGINKFGSVGEFPSMEGSIDGLTCLRRLRNVFKSLIRKQLPGLIDQSNFDHSCPYNMDEFQEPDARIYQSLDFSGLRIEGQRPRRDLRQLLFGYLLCKSSREEGNISHVDLGSNLGMFCFQAAGYPFVDVSLGLEAFQKYTDIANIIAFLYDFSKTRFSTFICGEGNIGDELNGTNFVTMFSVYHHIARKDEFLKDLGKLGAKYVLAEFATQDRYYPERGGLMHEIDYIQKMTGYTKRHVLALSKDYHRPIILFSNRRLNFFDRMFIRIANSKASSIGWGILFLIKLVMSHGTRNLRYE